MNSTDINLLSTSPVSHGKEKRLKQIRIAATIFIVIVGVSALITFFLNISSPLESVKKQENEVLAQITGQQEKAAKLAIVNERISAMTKLYSGRVDYASILNEILSKKTDEVQTSGLDIGESSVSVTVTSSSLLPLNNFLNSVIDLTKKNDKISTVFLESLTISQASSSYVMEVKVNLKNESR